MLRFSNPQAWSHAGNAMVDASLFPADEDDIAAYLAQRYYKFAK
jgi:hypothetical protein